MVAWEGGGNCPGAENVIVFDGAADF